MDDSETEIETALRHVYEGASRVLRQRNIIANLPANSHATGLAKELLATIEAAQLNHELRLKRLNMSTVSGPSPGWR